MSVTLTWTGHSTFLIDTGAGTILIDPFLDECPTASMKAADVACETILITHAHFDHMADAIAIATRTGAKVCCAFEIANWLGKQGVENLQPMNHGGRVAVPGGTAMMEIAFHSSSLPDGSYGGNPAGWLLDVAGKQPGEPCAYARGHGADRPSPERPRTRPGDPADRRPVHDGPRGIVGGDPSPGACGRPALPLRHLATDRAGCRGLG